MGLVAISRSTTYRHVETAVSLLDQTGPPDIRVRFGFPSRWASRAPPSTDRLPWILSETQLVKQDHLDMHSAIEARVGTPSQKYARDAHSRSDR